MSKIGSYVLAMMEASGEFESNNESSVTKQIEIDQENNLGNKNANHQHTQLAQQSSQSNDLRSVRDRKNIIARNVAPV